MTYIEHVLFYVLLLPYNIPFNINAFLVSQLLCFLIFIHKMVLLLEGKPLHDSTTQHAT